MKKPIAILYAGMIVGLSTAGCVAASPEEGDDELGETGEVEIMEAPELQPASTTYWACEGTSCGGYGRGVRYECFGGQDPFCYRTETNICC